MPKQENAATEDATKKPRLPGPNTRLTRDDWIRAAMDTLIEKSIDGVRVEVLAEDLKITKGSFYSHFSNRKELLDAVIADWTNTATSAVIERLDSGEKAPVERLRTLFHLSQTKLPNAPGGALELAIRAWARRDKAVNKAVQAIDKQRTDYVASLFTQVGFRKTEARARAVMYYTYLAGHNILAQTGEPEPAAIYRAVEELILAGTAPAAASADGAAQRQKARKST